MNPSTDKLLMFEKVLILKSLNLFSETPETILSELAPLMEEIEYEQDTVIFKEDEIGDSMFVIYKGEVKIHKANTRTVQSDSDRGPGASIAIDARYHRHPLRMSKVKRGFADRTSHTLLNENSNRSSAGTRA